ncbi:MAG: hypothetical protein WB492_06275 [Christiangramia sp.]
MKWRLFLAVFIFVSGVIYAQRDTREVIDASSIKNIEINTDEVYLITISTTKSSEIKINTHSEGEYYDDIILETSIKDNKLNISTKYPERLTGGFDKLSAHKVFSLEITLTIPENLEISVNSNIASLSGKGKFKSIYANLKQGYCKLLDFSGAAVINTYTGNILIETSSGLIEANSRNGVVDIPQFLTGRKPLRLTSIDGDIMVRKN